MASKKSKPMTVDLAAALRPGADVARYWEAAQAESTTANDPALLLVGFATIARARGMMELALDLLAQPAGTYDAVLAGCGPCPPPSGSERNMLARASLAERLAGAAFIRLVVKYDLRWEHEPKRHYPVGEMDWLPVGWLPMIERLIVRLTKLGWNRRIAQAKEKFGGLRWYVGRAGPAVRAAIDRAEARSYKTCDRCGQPGRQRVEEGSAVRCEKHRNRAGQPMGIKVLASTHRPTARHFGRES